MAFCAGVKMPKWSFKTLTTVLVLVDCIKILVVVAFSHLGLLKHFSTEDHHRHPQHPNNSTLVFDHLHPSIAPVPLHVLTACIKSLPVVQFGQVFEKYTKHDKQETVCSICLECIERIHEVREHCNCDHVFHRGCLDSWVNQGQITCPLCRALLFPANSETTSCSGRNSGTTERDAYFHRLELIVG